ncbi:hypothetical protein D3C80_1903110 [compost metagenome]
MAEQPSRPNGLRQRGFDQPPSHTLAALLRVDEQPSKPVAIAHRGQVQPCNNAIGTRHPQFAVTGRAHARAVLAVEVIEQASFRVEQP